MSSKKEIQRHKAKMVDARKYLDDHGSEWKPTSYVVPEGLESFRFEEPGLYMVDVVPYVVARHKGEPGGNPFVDEDDVGSLSYERTYYVHAGVGTDEKSYVCLHKEYKEDCPGCEYVQELLSNPAIDRKKVVNPRRPKERQLFLFYDRTTRESRKKGLQLYECAHYMSFGELLKTNLEACRLADPDSPNLNFADPEDGMTLAITVKKTSFSSDSGRSGNYNKPVNIQFVPRDQPLPPEILEAAPCLDDVPARISYEKFAKLLHEGTAKKKSPARDGEDERPAARTRPSPVKVDDDERDENPVKKQTAGRNGKKFVTAEDLGIEKGDQVEYEGEICTVAHVSGDGTSLRLEQEDGTMVMGVGAEEVKKVEEDDSPKAGSSPSVPGAGKKSAGATKTSSGSSKAAQVTDPDEDEDDEDEDEDQDDEDEDEDQDDDDDDEDDEDEKPAANKGAGKGGKGGTSRR